MYHVYWNHAAHIHSFIFITPVYKVYRGYIVFVFSVITFVGVCIGVRVCKPFFSSKISRELLKVEF